jgi:hypothetical protein
VRAEVVVQARRAALLGADADDIRESGGGVHEGTVGGSSVCCGSTAEWVRSRPPPTMTGRFVYWLGIDSRDVTYDVEMIRQHRVATARSF